MMKKIMAAVVMMAAMVTAAQAETEWKIRLVISHQTLIGRLDGPAKRIALPESLASEARQQAGILERFLTDAVSGAAKFSVEVVETQTGCSVNQLIGGGYGFNVSGEAIGWENFPPHPSRQAPYDFLLVVAAGPDDWGETKGWLGKTRKSDERPQTQCLALYNECYVPDGVNGAYYRFEIMVHELCHAIRFLANGKSEVTSRPIMPLRSVHDCFLYSDVTNLDFLWDWLREVPATFWQYPARLFPVVESQDPQEETEFGEQAYPEAIPSDVWAYLPAAAVEEEQVLVPTVPSPSNNDTGNNATVPVIQMPEDHQSGGHGCQSGWFHADWLVVVVLVCRRRH